VAFAGIEELKRRQSTFAWPQDRASCSTGTTRNSAENRL